MLWKDYEAKPIVRKAFEIKAPVTKVEGIESTFVCNGIHFKAYEQPLWGDFVVRLTEDDTYHCTKAVFHDRNIVPEGTL